MRGHAAMKNEVAEVPGLGYVPSFLTPEDELALLAGIATIDFREVRMHGVVAKRRVIHYGWDYDYEGWKIFPTDPTPEWLQPLVAACEAAAGLQPGALQQVMVAEYSPGAAIGWHRDAPMFGTPVIGVSLLAPCTMRFRRKEADGFVTARRLLEPRSLYLLGGPARQQWQHSIPAVKALRYSITFRTLRS
jgi:alkylated DNA repair protein (DNA oxidative demethylase)